MTFFATCCVRILKKTLAYLTNRIFCNSKQVKTVSSFIGTGKTFLGVKIAELLLYNRSVWCPSGTENIPILMVCQTNHALDQFLEHIINRLNMSDGIQTKRKIRFELFIFRSNSRWWSM
jgi:hypothetical protein